MAFMLAIVLIVRLEPVQERLVRIATDRLSSMLKTEVSVEHVNITFFNRIEIGNALVRDRSKDTLIFVGGLRVSLTDWFFLKDETELSYVGLADVVLKTGRTDSIWNYRFIMDAFSSAPKKKDSTRRNAPIRLQRLEIDRFRYVEKDDWYGRTMTIRLKHFDLDADEINLEKKKLFVHELELKDPYFSIYDYPGNRPPRPKKKKRPPPPESNGLQWNRDDWDILVHNIRLTNGTFVNDVKTARAPFAFFDGLHYAFKYIDADLNDISWQKDTISGHLNFSTRERSGLLVNQLDANLFMHPRAMEFRDLEIITPYSRLGNAFVMRYDEFLEDMNDFYESVTMEGRIINSLVDSRDLVYFAPELKGLDRAVRLNGFIAGHLTDLTANGFSMEYGKGSHFRGDLRMIGLPEVDTTRFICQITDFSTNYADAVSFLPRLSNISKPDLRSMGFLNFQGRFNGTISDFKVDGSLQSELGRVRTDLAMSFPEKGLPLYQGGLESIEVDMGRLLNLRDLGRLSFNGKIKGAGFDGASARTEFKGEISGISYLGYRYQDISVSASLKQQLFSAEGSIEDEHLEAGFAGSIDFNEQSPGYRLALDVRHSNLGAMNLTRPDITLAGRLDIDLQGRTPDDMNGLIKAVNLQVADGRRHYDFDDLRLEARTDSIGIRQLSIGNRDLHASMTGRFKVTALGDIFKAYLSKYYPMYFKAPKQLPTDQYLSFSARINNLSGYLPLLDDRFRGLDDSRLEGSIDSRDRSFKLKAEIPVFGFNRTEISDLRIDGTGDLDSLVLFANADRITFNDSLNIPGAALSIRSSRDVSDIRLNTSTTQTANSAQLSVAVQNLSDGVRILFNPSAIVVNDKTWRIDRNGQITISRSFIDASDVRIVNGQQEILVASLPSALGNSNDLLVTLRRVNLGDLLPYVLSEPKIEGITSGDITIEDPYGRMNIYLNAQTEQTRFEDDSIGITSINANWNNRARKATFFLNSANDGYVFDISGHADLSDSSRPVMDADIDVALLRMSILRKYLDIVFSDIDGTGQGKLKLSGELSSPDITGKVTLKDAAVRVGYTRCLYKLQSPSIQFRPGVIDFGTIRLRDTLGNEGQVSGTLTHRFFSNMGFNFSAQSKRLLLLNTSKQDNDLFYGKAIGRVNFLFNGPEDDMRLYMEGAPVDSSKIIVLTTGGAKEKGDVDYIVWRQYGREMNLDSLGTSSGNLSIDLDLKASNLLRVDVVLDELSGDVISAIGDGSLKIHTGTNEATTMNGRYNIERGSYNFNFQDIFKKPFTLEPGSGSYISWTGDPYNAELNVQARYLAEKVRMSSLFNDPNAATVSGVSSDILREHSDVFVMCRLTGTLSQPNPAFQILMPPYSTMRNNPTIDAKLKLINRDPLEVSKQATYLIVFKSFAPQAAVVASNMNSELVSNTISGVINSILANSMQNFFYKIFGNSMDVNVNYSRMQTNQATGGAGSETSPTNYRENVSFQFIKSMMNDKLIITFGSDFNFTTSSRVVTGSQSFLFLPDVNVEYKITPDGKFRTSFFYRSNFDAMSTSGRRDRTGGNISFRTEFDRLFPRKK
jgi:TamB, inner membrane protein subunit of TAM complex